jgi:hypothetical protein
LLIKRLLLTKALLLIIFNIDKAYPAESVDLKIYLKNDKSLKSLYQSTDFLPIWINDSFEKKLKNLEI